MHTRTFRVATLQDIPLLRRMAEETFPATYASILSPEQLDYMMQWMYSSESLERQIARDGHVFFIGYDTSGQPVGYVSVQPEANDVFHLQKLYVCPDFQHKGWGSALFTRALDYIRSQGGRRVELNVNRYNTAFDFYRHMGMHVARQGDFAIGQGFFMNDYIMSIDLM